MEHYETLLERLKNYTASDMLPMHMPGHKRRPLAPYLERLGAGLDLTEIDGMDDLHHPAGILKDAQERAAAFWGADESFFLVNGSTAGLLAALYAAVRPGEELLLARGAHRSVYHGIELMGLVPRFLLPPILPKAGCFGSLTPEAAAAGLERHPGAKALLVTSPTYEGVISDLAGIARVCREKNVLLLVDEAHGAHLGFGGFPSGAVAAGADLAVQSLHKTLPSLTQTAILHRNGERVDRDRLRHGLSLFQTSSPSYLLMASIDGCVSLLREQPELLSRWHDLAVNFRRELTGLSRVSLLFGEPLPPSVFAHDPGKLVLRAEGVSGFTLAEALRREHHIETEMAAPGYVLAMTGPGDTPESFARLAEALRALDRSLPESEAVPAPLPYGVLPEQVMTPGQAASLPSVFVPAGKVEGKIAAEAVWAYPPGIPLVLPGERIGPELAALLPNPKARLQSSRGRLPEEIAVAAETT